MVMCIKHTWICHFLCWCGGASWLWFHVEADVLFFFKKSRSYSSCMPGNGLLPLILFYENHLSAICAWLSDIRMILQVLLYILVAVILIFPFDIFYLSSRYFFLRTLFRIAFPFQVRFFILMPDMEFWVLICIGSF